ncbi:MAG: hypothetical protein GWP04_03235 [Gammaproteobacteria bacterium]|nr:hypothetical protein [Gammaproteobacteria bacterium]
MSVRIGVVGGLNMDIHLFDVSESRSQAAFRAGNYLAQPGGKGANQARAAAVLGAEVFLVGRVGDDEFGSDCRESVVADGVNAEHVLVTEGVRTGFVAIRLTDGHHQSLVYVPGANAHLTWSDVQAALPVLASCNVILVQAEIPADVLARLTTWAVGQDVRLFLDPAPPEDVTRASLVAAEAITPDLQEGTSLTGRSSTSSLSPVLSVRDLLDAGAKNVFLKLGHAGVIFGHDDELLRIPTLLVEPNDETGAGDVFIAALAVHRSAGGSWRDAARFANAASALSVSRPGLALPRADEVIEATADLPPEDELIEVR